MCSNVNLEAAWEHNIIVFQLSVSRIHSPPLVSMFSLVARRFLSSPNFVGWFSVRKEEANQKLRLLHLDMLCKAVGDCDVASASSSDSFATN